MSETKIFSGTITEISEKDTRLTLTIDEKKYSCFDKVKEQAKEILEKTKEVHGTFYENVKGNITYRNITKIKPGLNEIEEIDTSENEKLAKEIEESNVEEPQKYKKLIKEVGLVNPFELGLACKLALHAVPIDILNEDERNAYMKRAEQFYYVNKIIKDRIEVDNLRKK